MAGASPRQQPLLPEGYQPNLNFLTTDELFHTSDAVKSKVLQVLTDLTNSNFAVEAQYRNDKIAFEQQIFGLENELREKTQTLETATNQLQSERQSTESYITKYRTTLSQLSKLEETVSTKEIEINSLKAKTEGLVIEKNEVLTILERRNADNEKLCLDLQSTNELLQRATVAKIDALSKVDELTSKEIDLDYREKQLEKEKEWVSKQVQLQEEELAKRNAQITEMQRESGNKYMNIQHELAEKTDEIRIAEKTISSLKGTNEEQERQIERLLEKLKEAQDMETKIQENYRQELKQQKRIAELYKETSEDHGKKVGELETAVGNLQTLLKQATEKYNELESEYKESTLEWETKIRDQEKSITSLTQELKDANELLANIRKQGLTDEMVASLSPAAAAASAMLKNTPTLTEIFSKYQALHNELATAKDDNERLNEYIQKILKEISERAPGLVRQKEEYEQSLQIIDALQDQLNLALQEVSDLKIDNSHTRKLLGVAERENVRLTTQIKDMALQIRSLMREVEHNRGNYSFEEQDTSVVPDVTEGSASGIITGRLVTFRNIEELQAQNQNLLAVVRELSETQEAAEKDSGDQMVKQLKESLSAVQAEVEEYKSNKSKLEAMIESLNQQKDTLTTLLNQQRTPFPGDKRTSMDGSSGLEKIALLEHQVEEKRKALDKLQEEYDTYRREKSENERITYEQMEKLRDEVVSMRSENAKLACKDEYNAERAKNYTSNMDSYKKNINVLEERAKQYQTTIMKHEQSIVTLKNELTLTQQSLARVEVALSSTTQERNMLRDAKSSLQAERDLLMREHSTQQMLKVNLEEIKNNLEMANSAVRMRLENQLDQLQKENESLRRRHDTDSDSFREQVRAWDKTNSEMQKKVEQEQRTCLSLREELSRAQSDIRAQRKEIEELLAKVGSVSAVPADASLHIPGTPGPSSSRASNASFDADTNNDPKYKDILMQLQDAQAECKALQQQLELAKASLDQYKSLSQAMEEQLSSASSTSKNYNEDFSERLACKDDIIRDIQAKLDLAERENATLKDQKGSFEKENEERLQFLTEEVNRMRRELQSANSRLQSLNEENCNLRGELEHQTQIHQDFKDKFERELASHAEDVRNGSQVRDELERLKNEAENAARARKVAEETLNSSVQSWQERENSYAAELSGIKTSKEELEKLNESLQDQLINLTTQISSLRSINTSGMESGDTSVADVSFNTSFSEADARNSEQLLQLVKYLRREKEIANTKAEMAQTSVDRFESKLKFAEQQLADVTEQLREVQDKSNVSLITSAKQSELLRKVETLSALTDSNRLLREEKDEAVKRIEILTSKLQNVEAEITPLKAENQELKSKSEASSNENLSLREDASRWRQRAQDLLEKTNKINPEEMRKLQAEKLTIQSQLLAAQESSKKLQQENLKFSAQIRMLQQTLSTQQNANTSLLTEKKQQLEQNRKSSEDVAKIRAELSAVGAEANTLRAAVASKDAELQTLRADSQSQADKLKVKHNENINLKRLAKHYKTKAETLESEKLDLESKLAAETGARDVTTGENPEGQITDESLAQEVTQQKDRVQSLTVENESLKRELDAIRGELGQEKERSKLAMKPLQSKLSQVQQQKLEAETQLNEYKQRASQNEASSSEESTQRLAALKSQYEGRIAKLEKENKELRASAPVSGDSASESAGSSENQALVEENARMKRELDVMRPRVTALEKQLQLKQQQGQSRVPPGAEKSQTEPPKANIRPIAGTSTSNIQKHPPQGMNQGSRFPLTASIRPMSQQRKATVMPTTATTIQAPSAASSQQAFPGPSSMFVSPVSQAQVSTSTPDQSNIEHLQHIAVPSTSSNAASIRQAAVHPTPSVTITPISTASTVASPVQGPSGDRTDEASLLQEDISTSQMEEGEIGDSSEQVSSSESSQHLNATAVPARHEQPHFVAEIEGDSVHFAEEPSPSTSAVTTRPSQPAKRGRDSEVETSQEADVVIGEPDNKRSRVQPSSQVEREAEAVAQQDEFLEEDSELQELEADQGVQDEEDSQDPHSGGQGGETGLPEEEDEDVIVIDSDVEELEDSNDQMPHHHREDMDETVEDEEDLEEEGVEDEEDVGDEEDSNVESGSDEEGDDDDDNGGAEMHGEIVEDSESQDHHDEGEGREAESMEGQDNSQNTETGVDDVENENEVIELDEEFEVSEEPVPSGGHRSQPSVSVETIGSQGSSAGAAASSASSETLTPSYIHIGTFPPPRIVSGSQFEEVDDGIVPGTPVLMRRNEGSADPMRVPQQRFVFSTTPGMDDSRADLHVPEDGSGRSVPTTPLQISPPSDGALALSGVQPQTADVQPSSSDSAQTFPPAMSEVPSISVSYEGDDGHEPDDMNPEDIEVVHEEHETEEGASLETRAETSVTSSDETDATRAAAGTSLTEFHSTASNSPRALSPTPSSNTAQLSSSDTQVLHRNRPAAPAITPIIWSEPTSSSPGMPSNPPPPPRGMSRRGRISIGRPPLQQSPEPLMVPRGMGMFRPSRPGAVPSARRSRPSPRGSTRGSPFARPPF